MILIATQPPAQTSPKPPEPEPGTPRLPDFDPKLLDKLSSPLSKAAFIDRWLARRIDEGAATGIRLERRLATLPAAEEKLLHFIDELRTQASLVHPLLEQLASARQALAEDIADAASSVRTLLADELTRHEQTLAQRAHDAALQCQAAEELGRQRLDDHFTTLEAALTQKLHTLAGDYEARAAAAHAESRAAMEKKVTDLRDSLDAELVNIRHGVDAQLARHAAASRDTSQRLSNDLDNHVSAAQSRLSALVAQSRTDAETLAASLDDRVTQAGSRSAQIGRRVEQAMDQALASVDARIAAAEQTLAERSDSLSAKVAAACAGFESAAQAKLAAVRLSLTDMLHSTATHAREATEPALDSLAEARTAFTQEVELARAAAERELNDMTARLHRLAQVHIDKIERQMIDRVRYFRPTAEAPAASPDKRTNGHTPRTPAQRIDDLAGRSRAALSDELATLYAAAEQLRTTPSPATTSTPNTLTPAPL